MWLQTMDSGLCNILMAVFLVCFGKALGNNKKIASTKELCIDYAKHINHHHATESYTSIDDPRGTWVSSRCELIPGEKYIFRRFLLDKEKWSGKIFHYHDSWCNKPKFTVKFDGTYQVTSATATTHAQTSFTSEFKFTNIVFTSNTEVVIKDVMNVLLTKCPSAVPKLRPDTKLNIKDLVGKEIKIGGSAVQKKYCRFYLGLHIYSNRKIRMVKDTTRMKYQTLYFGNIPKYVRRNMRYFVPNSFQYGLARVDRPWCSICELAQSDKAPILPLPEEKNNFANKWVTETCQASDDRTYETFYYEFEPIGKDKKTGLFSIYHAIFIDPDCKRLKFDFKAGGSYDSVNPYEDIPDVLKMKLRYTWITMAAYDLGTLQLMKTSRSCGSEDWKYGVEQNVTSTKGCDSVLTVKLPYVADVILRANTINKKQELYLEELEPGLYFKNSLVACDVVTKNLMRKKTTSRPTPFAKVTSPTSNEVNKQIENRLREVLQEKDEPTSASVQMEFSVSLTAMMTFLYLFCFL